MSLRSIKEKLNRINVAIFISITIAVVIVSFLMVILTNWKLDIEFALFLQRQEEMFESMGRGRGIFAAEQLAKYTLITEDFRDTVSRSSYISMVIGIFVGVFISLFLSRLITKPLYILKENIKKYRRDKVYNARLDVGSFTEILELSSEYEELLMELDKLEELRKNMMSDIVHEMKTPITRLQGKVNGIRDGVFEPTDDEFAHILDNIGQLNNIVSRIRYISDIHSHIITDYNLESIVLYDIVETIVAGFDFKSKGLKVEINIPKDMEVVSDRYLLKEVMENLISNSYRYTDEGMIIISGDYNTLEVRDTGIGISAENLPYVFERFFVADKSRNKKYAGLGLGLSIVKEIVLLMGWSIDISSEVGKGSVVKISFSNT